VPNPPLAPKIELMLMTDPCAEAASAAADIFIPRNTPVWSTVMVRFQSSGDVSSMTARSPSPALLIRMSSPPQLLTARPTAASHCSCEVTSRCAYAAWPSAWPISAATRFPESSWMSVTRTAAPSAASRLAVAAPMPLPAPVTRATRPASLSTALLSRKPLWLGRSAPSGLPGSRERASAAGPRLKTSFAT